MAKLSFHDRLHIQKMLAQQTELRTMFSELIRKVSPELNKMTLTGKPNIWIRNAQIEANINKHIIEFADNLKQYINKSQIDAWARSTLKSDEFVKEYINGMAIDSIPKQGMFNRNSDAFKSFTNRAKNGITLSDQIWSIAEETKRQFEFYVGSGISEGRSAAKISQDIRQLLNDPDTQFRRKRDENGKLIPSQPMKDYHPGQGVYKSPYKNAMRLAVTETNMAYRTADYERWNQLDFVVGVEIQRSGNGGPCKICDPMVGKYPKGFKFVGWHPHCICFATPIMLNQDDFVEYTLNGSIPQDKIITSIPKQAEEYINKIAPKVENWKNKPYWMVDNYTDEDAKNKFSLKRILRLGSSKDGKDEFNPHKALKKIYNTPQEVVNSLSKINAELKDDKWFSFGFNSLEPEINPKNNGSTIRTQGKIWLKQDRLDNIKSTLGKIAQKKSDVISFDEADSMATFWHEITHNRNKTPYEIITPKERKYMELANEYVARKTLPEFYKKLGCKTPFPEFIDKRVSTGYELMVSKYDYVVKVCNLDKDKVLTELKNHLFNNSYKKQKIGLQQALKKGGIKSYNGNSLTVTEINEILRECLSSWGIDSLESYLRFKNIIR